jgi:hypothetical protein
MLYNGKNGVKYNLYLEKITETRNMFTEGWRFTVEP